MGLDQLNDFVQGKGIYVKIAALAPGIRSKPAPATITVGTGGAATGATTIPITAPGVTIPRGTLLKNGSKEVFIAETVDPTDTSITSDPLPAALIAGDTFSFDKLWRLLGGTQSEFQINEQQQEAQTYEAGGWSDGKITGAAWVMPWQGNFRPDDPAWKAIKNAALNFTEVWVARYLPREDGSLALVQEGVASIGGYRDTGPANGIVTAQWNFIGRGKPTVTEVAAV